MIRVALSVSEPGRWRSPPQQPTKGNPMHYLWLDLETTGLDPYLDDILEVAIAVTDETLEPKVFRRWLVPPTHDWAQHADQIVLEMHEQSGLLAELDERMIWFRLAEVETAIVDLIEPFLDKGRIVLAGSGVAAFDLQFIRAQMPDLAHFLAYYTLDIGVVRRFLHLAGVVTPALGPVLHRAFEDVEHHLNEARGYLTTFKTLADTIGNELHR